jgi:L-arabinose isomerase
MIDLSHYEVWFVTGSQHLYGPSTLETVAQHSRQIAAWQKYTSGRSLCAISMSIFEAAELFQNLPRVGCVERRSNTIGGS